MKLPNYLLIATATACYLATPSTSIAEPAHHQSIEWAIANSDMVITGKVIKAETANKHAVVTVEVERTLRGTPVAKTGNAPPQVTFVLQEFCSSYAQGWLEDKQPMMFFLVKFDGTKGSDKLPKGYQWVLNNDGNGNSAVMLGKTNRKWPGSFDVFTQKFDFLTDPAAIVKFLDEYAKLIPAKRIVESISVDVPHGTPAYERVFPPQYPGNAFYLEVPVFEQGQAITLPEGIGHGYIPIVLVIAFGCGLCIWLVARHRRRLRLAKLQNAG